MLFVFAGFDMLRNAFDMGLGCLGLLDLAIIANWHLIGCQNRRRLLASSATPPPTTTTVAVFGLLGCFTSHGANGILRGLVLGFLVDGDLFLRLGLGGGDASACVTATGTSITTCARSRSMRNCEVICPSSPRQTTRMP